MWKRVKTKVQQISDCVSPKKFGIYFVFCRIPYTGIGIFDKTGEFPIHRFKVKLKSVKFEFVVNNVIDRPLICLFCL